MSSFQRIFLKMIVFLTPKSSFVQCSTSYVQLFPKKCDSLKIFIWFPDECVWCFISVRLHPPPNASTCAEQTLRHCFQKQVLHVCYWSPSVVCASSILVSSLSLCGGWGADMWFPGQRWMYHSRVLSDLLWTRVHYIELTSRWLWKGMLYVLHDAPAGVVESASRRFPVRWILLVKSLQQEGSVVTFRFKTSAVKQCVWVCVKTATCPWYDLFW